MKQARFTITRTNRRELAREVAEAVAAAPAGHVLTVAAPDKSRLAEKKYHAMIGDIALQCRFLGRYWSEKCWKRMLVHAYVQVQRDEAKANGRPDPFPEDADLVPSIDGREVVQLGVQTREFTVEQSSDFIEYLYFYGVERNVSWSEPAKKIIKGMGRKSA